MHLTFNVAHFFHHARKYSSKWTQLFEGSHGQNINHHRTCCIERATPAAADKVEWEEPVQDGQELPVAWQRAVPVLKGLGVRSPICPGTVPRTAADPEAPRWRSSTQS